MTHIERIATNPRRGRAVVHNGTVHIGGQVAGDRSGDIRSQTRQVLTRLDQILAEAGSHKRRLLTAQIWLKDISSDFAGLNEEWDAWIEADSAPARATAQCEMGAPDVLVEIIVTAAIC